MIAPDRPVVRPCVCGRQVVRLALEEVWERRGPELKSLVAEEAQDVEFVMRMVAYLDDRLTYDHHQHLTTPAATPCPALTRVAGTDT